MHTLVHEHGAKRRTALTRRTEAAEESTLNRDREIRRWGDHHGVLSAELKAGRLEVPSAQLTDALADHSGPRESKLVHQPLRQGRRESVECGRSIGLHDLKHAVGQAG